MASLGTQLRNGHSPDNVLQSFLSLIQSILRTSSHV
jgi:hypothetical protein